MNVIHFHKDVTDIAVVLFCCSDLRLCKRGLNEHRVSEEPGNLRMETDSVHSDDQDDVCGSSNLADTGFSEEVEKTDDFMFDGEFAQDAELMKSMGLPLSFTQASERRQKKVCIMHTMC